MAEMRKRTSRFESLSFRHTTLSFSASFLYTGMVELADTPDLGSGAKACRFKSCYPYQLQTAQQCGLFDFYDILTVDKTVTVYRS